MKERKVWILLAALELAETRQFLRYLSMVWGERRQYVQQLARVLVEALPHAPEREVVWHQLFPEQPYNDARLRKLLGDLFTNLEEFLTFRGFRRTQEFQPVYFLQELLSHDLPELFETSYRKALKQLSSQPFRGAKYFRARLELAQLYQRYWLQYSDRKTSPNDEEASQMFEYWWMTEKMNHTLVQQSLHPDFSPDPSVQFIFDRLLTHDPRPEADALWIYIQLYRFLSGEAGIQLQELQQQIMAHERVFHESDLSAMFTLLRNHLIAHLRRDRQPEIGHHLLQLYQWGIERGWLLDQGFLGWDQYKNILTLCLWLERFDLAERYLGELTPLLREELQSDAYAFNLASYHFARGNFAGVIETLREKRFGNISVELPARLMLLQAAYERDSGAEEEWLIGQLESAAKYLRSKKLPPDIKTSYRQFLRLTKKLILAYTTKSLEKLQAEVETITPLFQKKWLIQKVLQKRSESA